jgi:hypothetical protein
MADDRKLLDVLKAELVFLEEGGYRQSPRHPWRPPVIFADSPTCMNYTAKPGQRRPCSECILTEFVPAEHRDKGVPCHHIPLTEQGDTVDSIYRWGTQEEVEEVVGKWLRATIQRLEERQAASSGSE